MPPQTPIRRMETVEAHMADLDKLPTKVDALASQISQLRDETHVEFSAVRDEMRAEFSAVRREARVYYEDLVGRLKLLYEGRDPSVGPLPPPESS